MDIARAFRDVKRERKAISKRDGALLLQEKHLTKRISELMQQGKLSTSFKLEDGANIHTRHEVWGSIKKDISTEHARAIFRKYDLSYMFSTTPNAQSLRGWIGEHMDDDKTKTAVERLRGNIPDDLLEILNVSEVDKVAANGL